MPPKASPGQQHESGAEIEAASKKHAPGLFLFWSGLWGGAAYAALERGAAPDLLLLLVRCSSRCPCM